MNDLEVQGMPEDNPKPPSSNEPTDRWNIFAKAVSEIDGKYRWGQYIVNRSEVRRSITKATATDILLYRGKPVVKFTYPITDPEKFTVEFLYKKK